MATQIEDVPRFSTDFEDLVTDTEAARDSAQQSETSAEEARDAAQQAEANAEAAEVGAVAAQDLAQEAATIITSGPPDRTIYLDRAFTANDAPLFDTITDALAQARALADSGQRVVVRVGVDEVFAEVYSIGLGGPDFWRTNIPSYTEQPEDTLIDVTSPFAEAQRHRLLFGGRYVDEEAAFDIDDGALAIDLTF